MPLRMVGDAERRARLAVRHALADRVGSAASAARAVVCLHATEPASVHLAVAARSDASLAAVDAALYDERSVVKQLAMRRTVFAFPRELLPAVWASAAARTAAQQRDRLARDVVKGGLAEDGDTWVRRTSDAVLELLAEQGPMTTMELRAAVPAMDGRFNPAPGKKYGREIPIGPRVLITLAASGRVLRGENAGPWKTSRPRWTLCEQWLGEAPEPLEERAGYAELVRAWLGRFGPGTEVDIVWWLGATKAAVRCALSDVGALEVATSTGTAYVLPGDEDPTPPPQPWAALLPALDPTTMGWKQRGFYLGENAGRVFDRNGNAGPTAWWDGRVVGGWRQQPDGGVEVVPCTDLGAEATAALAAEAERLTEWLAGEVVVTIYQAPLVRSLNR
ncbi:MAG: winged helix DNA-binding domain-containing protein [Marmoricola sp.]